MLSILRLRKVAVNKIYVPHFYDIKQLSNKQNGELGGTSLTKKQQNKINIDKHKQATGTREPIATATQTMLEKEDRCS